MAGKCAEKPSIWLLLDGVQVLYYIRIIIMSVTVHVTTLICVCPILCVFIYVLQDPMNFGAILRCVFFLGAEGVLTTTKNWYNIEKRVHA